MNSQKLEQQVLDVIKWNAVSRNGIHNFSQETVGAQLTYVYSEAKETVQAFLQNDVKEILDGIADIMVTASYLSFLVEQKPMRTNVHESELHNATEAGADHVILVGASQMMGLTNYVIQNDLSFYGIDIEEDAAYTVANLSNIAEIVYGVDMCQVIDAVLESNWSKFPLLGNWNEIDLYQECRWIEANRGKTDVKWNIVEVEGQKYVVYRDKNGTGKIQKPSAYKEPTIVLPQ